MNYPLRLLGCAASETSSPTHRCCYQSAALTPGQLLLTLQRILCCALSDLRDGTAALPREQAAIRKLTYYPFSPRRADVECCAVPVVPTV